MANDKSVGKYVAEDFRKAEVFKRHGIDFCCGGGISLKEACANKNLDIDQIKTELAEIDQRTGPADEDFDSWELDKLTDYIVDVHHTFITERGPEVKASVNRVKLVHGEHKPNVTEISDRFDALLEELESHLVKEERILFPYIKQLVEAKKSGIELQAPFGTVQNPINMMLLEHDSAGNELEALQQLTEDYAPPKGACATHKVSYGQLKEFADDLMRHIHLENNILFPKALALESS